MNYVIIDRETLKRVNRTNYKTYRAARDRVSYYDEKFEKPRGHTWLLLDEYNKMQLRQNLKIIHGDAWLSRPSRAILKVV